MMDVDDIVAFALYYLNIVVQPHQRKWLEHIINGGPRVLLLAPRGHGKTTTVINVLLTYVICKYPHIKILLASHKEVVAKRQSRMIQNNLLRKKIREDFGITKGTPWRRDEFYITVDGVETEFPCVFVCSGQAGVTGFRFDWIVFDDLLVMENSKNELVRSKLMDWIENEVLKARDPSPLEKILVVGTRKHHKDWYSQLVASKFYESKVDGAILDDKSVLWSEMVDEHDKHVRPMYTLAVLEERKITEGARSFAQEYQNNPAPPEGMELKREWLLFYDELPPQQFLDIFMGIDPSFGSEEDGASSLAIAVIAFDHRADREHIYILEMFKEQMTRGKQVEKILAMHEQYKPISTNIEGVFGDKHIAQHVIDRLDKADIELIDYMHTPLKGVSDKSKDARIRNYIGLYFEDKIVSMLDPAYSHASREFIETEYIEFPYGEKDLLDALNMAVDLVDLDAGGSDELPIVAF